MTEGTGRRLGRGPPPRREGGEPSWPPVRIIPEPSHASPPAHDAAADRGGGGRGAPPGRVGRDRATSRPSDPDFLEPPRPGRGPGCRVRAAHRAGPVGLGTGRKAAVRTPIEARFLALP